MARNLGINIKIGADLKKFSTDMQNVTRQMRRTGKKMQSIGKSMTMAFTVPLGLIGGAMIKMASDTEESLNKVDVAFGESSQQVKDFADTTLKSFGIARGSSLEMASTFGDMATSMGINQSAAAGMSTKLVGLAGDLASFKNIRIDVAQTALNSIFTGETESLKKLGIVMTQANLSAFALEQGITKPIKAMSEGEKVMLRYNFVMAKTANAHGDFERTGGGAANQMRIFQEGLKQLAEEFGTLVLPMFTKVVNKLNQVVEWFSSLSSHTKKTILLIGGLVAAAGPLLVVFGGIMTMLAGIPAAMVAMAGPIGLVVAGLTAITIIITKNWSKIAPKLQEIANYFTEIYNESLLVRVAVNGIVLVFKILVTQVKAKLGMLWSIFKIFVGTTSELFKGVGNILKGALTLNLGDIKKGLGQIRTALISNMGEAFTEIRDDSKETANEIKSHWQDFSDSVNKVVKPIVIPAKLKIVGSGGDDDGGGADPTGGKGAAGFDLVSVKAKNATKHLKLFGATAKETQQPIEGLAYSVDGLHDPFSRFFANVDRLNESFKRLAEDFLTSGVVEVFESIGKSMVNGASEIDNLGTRILGNLGDFLGTFGKMLISAGIASLALFESLFAGPVGAAVAIGAGIALVAASGAIKAHVANVGSSTSGGGGTSNYNPPRYSGTGTGGNVLTLETVVYGNDIVLSSNRQHGTVSRTRRK